jgi:hypothetical protein
MSDSEERIRRWRLRIEECRLEAENLGQEGRITMQSNGSLPTASFWGFASVFATRELYHH